MSSSQVSALYAEGQRLLAAGRSIVPVRGKVPVIPKEEGGWDHLKSVPLTDKELHDLCEGKRPTGIAIIGGEVSQGAEILDFDYKLGRSFWHDFKERAGNLLDGIPFQRTGSGNGFQGAYLCPKPGGNQKLAAFDTGDPDPRKRYQVLIETRGEGGYALVPPSLHPDTHKHYRYVVGDFVHLPFISQDRRDSIIELAKSLTEKREQERKVREFVRPTEEMTAQRVEASFVIERYNRTTPIDYVLSSSGYSVHGEWAVRPGGKRRTVKIDYGENRSFHNAANDPMCDGNGKDGHWKRPFDFLCYDLGGDFVKALREAARIVGVELATTRSRAEPLPMMPEKPVAPKKARHNLIIVTDHYPDLAVCERLGIPAVVSPRHLLIPEVVAAVEPFESRIVVSSPPENGYSDALAADLRARLVHIPEPLSTLVDEGRVTLLDLVAMIRSAVHPAWRPGLGGF